MYINQVETTFCGVNTVSSIWDKTKLKMTAISRRKYPREWES